MMSGTGVGVRRKGAGTQPAKRHTKYGSPSRFAYETRFPSSFLDYTSHVPSQPYEGHAYCSRHSSVRTGSFLEYAGSVPSIQFRA
jgi:hypothetical protein